MRKYFVLTSVLALCACGGGSGGGGGGSGAPVTPTNVRSAITDADVLSSNSNVTKMATEILVANDNSGTPILNRSATVRQNGHTYTSYRLDDVNFRVATGANDAYMRFNMDETGKIDSLIMDTGNTIGVQHMDRNEDTNQFRGIVYEYIVLSADDDQHMDDPALEDRETLVRMVVAPSNDINDYSVLSNAASGKCPAGKSCRWDRIDQAFRVSAQGSNFKYSDFGQLETDNFGKYKGVTENTFAASKTQKTVDGSGGHVTSDFKTAWNQLSFDRGSFTFAGGYNVDAVKHRPTETTTFTGKAIGSVYASNSATHSDVVIPLQDDAATLTFAVAPNGSTTETLNMAFDNWYDVTVTKDANGNNIQFTNLAGEVDSSDENGVTFRNDGSLDKDNFTTAVNADSLKTQGLLDMGYYGINSTEEATGVVRYKETTTVGNTQYEREFNAGYGMTPDVH